MKSTNDNNSTIQTRPLLLEQDNENLSTFRKRNKLIILIFSLLIISLTLVLCLLITYLIHNNPRHSHKPLVNPAVEAFCSVARDTRLCLNAFDRIISVESSTHPDRIFALSLQTAATRLEDVIASGSDCSGSLRTGLGRIRKALAQVGPFLETRSDEDREEMMGEITRAEENLNECVESRSEGVSEVMKGRVQGVKVYVRCSGDFVMGYVEALGRFWREIYVDEVMISDEMVFCMCVGGLQLLFMVFMFWALFRFR